MAVSRGTGAAPAERGAVAVEAAFVLPLLILLVFGMIEFAFALKDEQGVVSAVRAGARTGSAATSSGNTAFAQDTADTVARALTAVPRTSVTDLWIYRADRRGDPAGPGAGAPAVGGGDCSPAACVKFRYDPASNTFTAEAGYTWDYTSIVTCRGQTGGCTRDAIGVYLRVDHHYLTGLIGSVVGLSDRAVLQFEPVSS